MSRVIRVPFLAAALLCAGTLAACAPTASAHIQPAGSPSETCTLTARPSMPAAPDMEFLPGDKPYFNLKADNISRIRMIVYRDSQAPEFPDPFKDATSSTDVKALLNILNNIQIKVQTDAMHMPVGATGYAIFVTMKDGGVTQIYLYGDHNLSQPHRKIYEIDKLPDMEAAYKAISARERLLPNTSDTIELENSSLFEIDGRNYYFEPVDGRAYPPANLVREDGNGNVEIVDSNIEVVHPAVFKGRDRIIFLGYSTGKGRDVDVDAIVSINPDGTERKVLNAAHDVIDTPTWDGGYLYYVGWAKDLKAYPRPLYRVDENLTQVEKVMDLPGPLLTVKEGDVFCLSTDRTSILRLPSGETVATFASRVDVTEVREGKWILYEKNGTVNFWTVEGGVVAYDPSAAQ